MKRFHAHTRGELPSYMDLRLARRTEEESTAVDDATGTTASTASGGTSGSPTDQSFETPFRLEDVDEAYRADVERYVKQTQGAFTRKTQELAQIRKTLEPHQELVSALDSDDEATRDAAAKKLLDRLGWDVEGGQEEETTPPPAAGAGEDESDVAKRLAAIEQREQARTKAQEEEAQQAYLAEFKRRVDTGVEAHVKTLKLDPSKESDKAAIERERQAIVAYLSTLDPLEGDMPDVDGAITLRKADVAALQQAASDSYRQTKDTPDVKAGGASGSPARPAERRDAAARRAAALEVAGRHF